MFNLFEKNFLQDQFNKTTKHLRRPYEKNTIDVTSLGKVYIMTPLPLEVNLCCVKTLMITIETRARNLEDPFTLSKFHRINKVPWDTYSY